MSMGIEDDDLNRAIREGLERRGIGGAKFDRIVHAVAVAELTHGLLQLVKDGRMEIAGIDHKGELQFAITDAGSRYVENMPGVKP